MINTNCGNCGLEIDSEMAMEGNDCHLCQDCYLDYYFKRLKPDE